MVQGRFAGKTGLLQKVAKVASAVITLEEYSLRISDSDSVRTEQVLKIDLFASA